MPAQAAQQVLGGCLQRSPLLSSTELPGWRLAKHAVLSLQDAPALLLLHHSPFPDYEAAA
jgi:hypothetical protein